MSERMSDERFDELVARRKHHLPLTDQMVDELLAECRRAREAESVAIRDALIGCLKMCKTMAYLAGIKAGCECRAETGSLTKEHADEVRGIIEAMWRHTESECGPFTESHPATARRTDPS